MKNMNRIELNEFTNKYFKEYKGDIINVSYIIHKNLIEYLINGHYIYIIKKNKI